MKGNLKWQLVVVLLPAVLLALTAGGEALGLLPVGSAATLLRQLAAQVGALPESAGPYAL